MEVLLGQGILTVLEIGLVVFSAFYILFSIVVLRQVYHMTDTLEVGFEDKIKAIAWLHLIFAISTLAASIVVML